MRVKEKEFLRFPVYFLMTTIPPFIIENLSK